MKAKYQFTVISVLLVFITGCAMFNSNLTSQQRYLAALQAFNGNVQDYLIAYEMASPETQEKWKSTIDPAIQAASTALDTWYTYIGASSEVDKEMAWSNARDVFLGLLFQYGILGGK